MSTLGISEHTFLNLAHTLAGCDYTGNGQKYQRVGHDLVTKGNEYGFAWVQGYSNPNPNNREYDGLFRLFGYLSAMNHRAYVRAYKHHGDMPSFISLKAFKHCKKQRLNIYQVLKSLQAIKYNIDVTCEPLDRLILLVQDAIIDNLPEYNSAHWG